MLEIKNIKKSFSKKRVLKGISLTVEKGDIIGIIGPSGCGKSTLLRTINYLAPPDDGSIVFEGNKIEAKSNLISIRRKIGMVFQQFNLFENMTILENIILSPVETGIMTKNEAIKEAKQFLKKIDLIDKKDFYPSQLSGGQKQRIAIIRSLMMKPELMLFDEPTSALDPEMIGEVTNLMREIANEGMTMIVVSHEMNFIKNCASRVLFLENGKIEFDGTVSDAFDKKENKRLNDFLSSIMH